jgi:hypothetical protein
VNHPACRALTKQGTACRAMPLPGRDVCIMHAPDQAEKVAAARVKGGTAAAKIRLLQGRRLKLDTPAALVRFTSGIVQDTLAGTVEVDVARTVLYGVGMQLKALEMAQQAEVRELLAEVERLTRLARQAR